MGIPDEDISRVRDNVDIVALISDQVQLKRVGQRWQGLCPFHQEKSPSFSVNPDSGVYYCFGCGAKGDAITFVRETLRLDFVDAVQHLAQKAGVTIRFEDPSDDERFRKRSRLIEIMSAAVALYHDLLRTSSEGGPARKYLRDERGYTKDDVIDHVMGWAPRPYGFLAKELNVDVDTLISAGLMHPAADGKPARDVFAGRIVFPIFDPSGKPIGFGGRIMPGSNGPKYKNSPDGALYNKSRVLYGLNWAKADIVSQGNVVVCEGYTDTIGMRRAGVTTAVATCGTALTEDHARLLARYTNKIVLAFDADTAGAAAAARFHQWEEAMGLNVFVAVFPQGTDPDELSRTDPDRLKALVDSSVPMLRFRVEQVFSGADMSTPEGRSQIARDAAVVVHEHPNAVLRAQYLREIADRTNSDVSALSKSTPSAAPKPTPLAVRSPSSESAEVEALRAFFTDRDASEAFYHSFMFSDPDVREAFETARQFPAVFDAIENSPRPEVADLISRCAVEGSASSVYEMACRLLHRCIDRRFRLLQSQVKSSDDAVYALEVSAWAKPNLALLSSRDSQASLDAFDVLVTWVLEEIDREEADTIDDEPATTDPTPASPPSTPDAAPSEAPERPVPDFPEYDEDDASEYPVDEYDDSYDG